MALDDVADGFVLRLFVEVTGKHDRDVLEVCLEVREDFEGLSYSLVHELFLRL